MRFRWAPDLFLDIGSHRTVFAVAQQVVFDEPTCIAYYPDSAVVVAIGSEAVSLQHAGPSALHIAWPVCKGRISNPVATQLFLQTLFSRAETHVGTIGKFLGCSGRYTHPTLVSPAELHIFGQVLGNAGMANLRPTALAHATIAALRKKQLPAEVCMISISSDWTECSLFVGEQPVNTSQINWGFLQLITMVRQVVSEKLSAHISQQAAEQVVTQVLDCGVLTEAMQSISRKDVKISVKAKKHSATTSTAIVLSQSLFTEHLQSALSPLAAGVTQFLSGLSSDLLDLISQSGIRLSGEGEHITGLAQYIGEVSDSEVVWEETPRMLTMHGLQVLDKK